MGNQVEMLWKLELLRSRKLILAQLPLEDPYIPILTQQIEELEQWVKQNAAEHLNNESTKPD
jgi:hypothetical protein